MKRIQYLVAAILLMSVASGCRDSGSAVDLKRASLALADGSPISQAATDEYNPYVVKMPDGYLMLVFASDRSCGGCTAGTQNIFVARSVGTYNNDQKIPAFNTPVVLTVAATPLNYSSVITFAATASGSSLRIFLNNTLGIIQYADYSPAGPTYNAASLSSITNAPWRKATVVGVDDTGTGLFARRSNGAVYWFNPAVINIALNAMASTGYTSVLRVSPSQSGMQDAYFTLANGALSYASYSTSGSTLTKLQSTVNTAKVTVKALSIAHTASQSGDFIVLSASDFGQSKQDLYVADGMPPAQLWADASSKPASGISSVPAAATGIYAWYELDGNRNDASGSGNNAFLPTTPFSGADPSYAGTDRFGMANSSATFNGTSQYIGNNFLAKCDENFSVSLWLKPAAIGVSRTFVGYQVSPSTNPGFTLNQDSGNQFLAQSIYDQGANTANNYGFGGSVVAGQWTHFAYVQDSTTRVGTVYINGTAVVTTANTAGTECGTQCTCSGASPVAAPQQWRTSTPMTIGYGYRGFFSGDMDQVAFFNRKLTLAEIQVLATQ